MELDYWKILLPLFITTYSVLFGIVAKKLWDLPKTIDRRLQEFETKLDARLGRIDEEAKLSHRRISVHDRISSKIIAKEFDSRAVAESGIYPEFQREN
jgi:hypothetical protein